MFDESDRSGQLPLLYVEDSSRPSKNIKNNQCWACYLQWLYGPLWSSWEIPGDSCFIRAREERITGYSLSCQNKPQGALIRLHYSGINRNSTRGVCILKVQELVFWRYSGFLSILRLLRARETEYHCSSRDAQDTVQEALNRQELTGIINKNRQEPPRSSGYIACSGPLFGFLDIPVLNAEFITFVTFLRNRQECTLITLGIARIFRN